MEKTKTEVLRYLGYRAQEISDDLNKLVDDSIGECRRASKAKAVWRVFDAQSSDAGVLLAGTSLLLTGQDIRRHLRGAGKVAVLAVTLGVATEALIRRWELVDMTRALILDASATQLIEEAADAAQLEIAQEAQSQGLRVGTRYSPGYGDLPLTLQPLVLDVLSAGKRIGLTCTESLILLPRKSVTAFAGLYLPDQELTTGGGCESCALQKTCNFKKDGGCGGCARDDKK